MAPGKQVWDVAVIGGGAAGMMAAGVAARAGARVILLEKNTSLGKKLLITGGGRCNVTNVENDIRGFLKHLTTRGKPADQFLFSPFSRHSIDDSLTFFHERGMPTKVEARGRVFPESDSARSVYDVLVEEMRTGAVTIQTGAVVVRVEASKGQIQYVELKNEQRIYARSYIFATGGLSRPDTGSTGDGFGWVKKLGHTVHQPDPSLVPLTLKDAWAPSLAGVSLQNITLLLREDGKTVAKQSGTMLFTHKGISGPAALNLSRDVGERLPYGPVVLHLNLLPHQSLESLDRELQARIAEESNRKIQNVLASLIPTALVSVVCSYAQVDGDTPAHSVTREQRIALGSAITSLPLTVKGRLGFEKAIIASGGVPLSEIDTKTMRSLVIDNLYIVGDLLDIDRPSGGYSLQLCWTTGAVAGMNAAA